MKIKTICTILATSFVFQAVANEFPTDDNLKNEMSKIEKLNLEGAKWDDAVNKAEKQREVFSQVESRPNNFPNIQVDKNQGVDIEILAEKYKRKAENIQNYDGVIAFASLSMPKDSIKKMVADVTKVGGVVVFRGFKDGSYIETAKVIQELGLQRANVQINPNAFKQYKVSIVPAIAVIKPQANEKLDLEGCVLPEYHSKVTGDVSLKYALQIIQDNESKDLSQIATRYLTYLDRSGR